MNFFKGDGAVSSKSADASQRAGTQEFASRANTVLPKPANINGSPEQQIAVAKQAAKVFDAAIAALPFGGEAVVIKTKSEKIETGSTAASAGVVESTINEKAVVADAKVDVGSRDSKHESGSGQQENADDSKNKDSKQKTRADDATISNYVKQMVGGAVETAAQKKPAKEEQKTAAEGKQTVQEAIDDVVDAIRELSAMGPRSKLMQDRDDSDLKYAVGFTLVEQDDPEEGFRRFTLYAEDDEELAEPWQLRFSEEHLAIEVFVREKADLQGMMANAIELEKSISERTGLKVTISFKVTSN